MTTAQRWTPRRKAELMTALAQGRLSPADALVQFGLSPEELAFWQRDLALAGIAGLRATRLQAYHPRRLPRPRREP